MSKFTDYPRMAKLCVLENGNLPVVDLGGMTKEEAHQLSVNDITLQWFAKTLQNWKAFLGCRKADNFFWEVTHNGDKGETYIDTYVLTDDILILPEELMRMEHEPFHDQARLVAAVAGVLKPEDMYVVWHNAHQGNWNALVSMDKVDGHYWQVSYHMTSHAFQVQTFNKVNNSVLEDAYFLGRLPLIRK